MKINGQIYNIATTIDTCGHLKTMRLEFDVATSVGEFHFDSDDQPINRIRELMLEFGISDHMVYEKTPMIDMDINTYNEGDAY